jgi:hypothetical protein
MGLALAVLVLAALSVGFLSLMLLPLVFIWLAFSVYTEPWKVESPEALPAHAGPEAAAPPWLTTEPTPEEKVEKPRVMVAGRRRPL